MLANWLLMGNASAPSPSTARALLHMNGTNLSNTYPDVYGNYFYGTGYANCFISQARALAGNASVKLDGNSCPVQCTAMAANRAAWTIEGWIYLTGWNAGFLHGLYFLKPSGGYGYVLCFWVDAGLTTLKFREWVSDNNASWNVKSSVDTAYVGTFPSLSTWYHIAASYDGTTLSTYFNGTRVSTTTCGQIGAVASILGFGADGSANITNLQGWMDECRLSDTCRYSGASIVVPTYPFTS